LGGGGEENKGDKRLICGYNFRVAENTTPITGFAVADCRKRSFIIVLDTETTVTALMSTGRTDNASSRQNETPLLPYTLILFGRYVTLTSQSQPGLAYGWRSITCTSCEKTRVEISGILCSNLKSGADRGLACDVYLRCAHVHTC